jgi:hypothetical protein
MQNKGEDNTENNRVPESGNTSYKAEMNMLDFERVVTQMKNKSPGYDDIHIC